MLRPNLQALQLERLRDTVTRAAAGVEHYRVAYGDAGVGAEDIKTLDDISRFPFTFKEDLRKAYPFGWFAVDRKQVVRVHASSGTTGKPIVSGSTRDDIDTWAGLMARSMYAAGVRPGDIVHNTHGYGLFTGGLGVHYGAERLGCMIIPISGGQTKRQIALLRDFGASAIVGTPSYIVHLIEVARADGVDLVQGPLRSGLFGGEPWCEQMRAQLEDGMGIRAHDLYGLCEIMGPGVACECSAQDGLHGWEDHFLFEIIDPETGKPLPIGSTGELVITTLTREAMPIIRYRTGDITRLQDKPCACGRSHVRIQKVTGRSDDMLIIRGVNVYPSQIESVLMGFSGMSPHYRILVERESGLDTLTVEAATLSPAHLATEGLADEICTKLKAHLGVTCRVQLIPEDQLPRSTGKARRVWDLRK
jgi:phenylacetate-CoA ligase